MARERKRQSGHAARAAAYRDASRRRSAWVCGAGCLLLFAALLGRALAGSRASSVNVGGCSGTIIAIHGDTAWGVSAGHCATKGKQTPLVLPDGTRVTATWRYIDSDQDLSLFSCPSKGLEWTPVGAGTGSLTGWSWPAGKGLSETVLVPDDDNYTTGLKVGRSAYRITAGKFRNGSSGGGVFQGGRLIGVASHGRDDKVLLACEPEQLDSFLRDAQRDLSVTLMSGPPPAPQTPPVGSQGLLQGPLKSDNDRRDAITKIRRFLEDLDRPDAGVDASELHDLEKAVTALETKLRDLEMIKSRLRDLENHNHEPLDFRVELVVRLKPTTSVKVRER